MTSSAPRTSIKQNVLSRPEHELLLCCAHARKDASRTVRIKALLAGEIDWNYLYNLAKRHSILQLFYWQLKESAPETASPEHLRRFKDNYRDNAARNIFLTGELVRLLKNFAAGGIEAVPYKGPALALAAYGNLSLRRFVDLDVMVRKCDVACAIELLEQQEYQTQIPLSPSQLSMLLRTQHNLPFTREQGRLMVELHWEVASHNYARGLQAEVLWERLQTLTINDVEVSTLSPEDLLLSLCVHGTKHLWDRLAWICDVAELINSHPMLDWEIVFGKARESGYVRMLLLMLRLASDLLDVKIPDDVSEQAFADRDAARLAEQVATRMFESDAYKAIGLFENMRFNLVVRKSWAEKGRYLQLMLTPTDGDLTMTALPKSLAFLYYFLRPFRLLIKGSAHH